MPTMPAFDLPRVPNGAHVCALSVSDERRVMTMAGYLADGLARGARCSFVGSAAERAEVAEALAARGVAIEKARAQGALTLNEAESFYRPDGTFRAERSLAVLRAVMDEARTRGFRGFRGAGLPSFRGEPVAEVLRYEAGLTELVGSRPEASVLCCFDRRATPAGLLRRLLQAHASALLGDRLCGNPFFDPQLGRPHASPLAEGTDQATNRAVDWMITQLIRSQDGELELREAYEALLRAQDAHGADRCGRAVELRDRLLESVARQLAGSVAGLRAALDREAAESGCGGQLREELTKLEALAARLGDLTTFLSSDDLPTEASDACDFVDLARAAVEAFRLAHPSAAVELCVRQGERLRGTWDPRRVRRALAETLAVAHEHGWGTPIVLAVTPVGRSVRVTVRYQLLDPDAASTRTSQERLSIELFAARDLLRRMDGTLGISVWPDESVVLTAELPIADDSGRALGRAVS